MIRSSPVRQHARHTITHDTLPLKHPLPDKGTVILRPGRPRGVAKYQRLVRNNNCANPPTDKLHMQAYIEFPPYATSKLRFILVAAGMEMYTYTLALVYLYLCPPAKLQCPVKVPYRTCQLGGDHSL